MLVGFLCDSIWRGSQGLPGWEVEYQEENQPVSRRTRYKVGLILSAWES